MSDVAQQAAFSLQMALTIIPSQSVGGVNVWFAIRFTRMVSHSDIDDRIELQVHSVTGREHDFVLKTGTKLEEVVQLDAAEGHIDPFLSHRQLLCLKETQRQAPISRKPYPRLASPKP